MNASSSRRSQIAWLIVVIHLLVGAAAVAGALRLEREEDLLTFLPERDADVQQFRAVSERFGSLKVALIGVEAPPALDMLSAAPLGQLARATDALSHVTGVDRVLSLSNVLDVVSGPLGAEISSLIPAVPKDEAEHRALHDKVLSRTEIVQNLISKDARAALILVFLADKTGTSTLDALETAASHELSGLKVFYGGAPFAGRAVYEEAERDVRALSPVALAILFLVVIVAFRDPVGVALTISSVGFSLLVVLGAMGFCGVRFTVATATLPVILFASGSSYAIHVLGRYYLERATAAAVEDALPRALRIVSPPLAIAAATTAVGFFAFVSTDVRPMRAFGLACGAGVLLCFLSAITLVSAVLTLFPRPAARPISLDWIGRPLDRLRRFSERRRMWIVTIVLAVTVLSIQPMRHVIVRMDPQAFFRPGSPPWLAHQFLEEHFGGATFLELAVSGDLDHPATLREIERISDFARTLPGVTQSTSILGPLREVNRAMSGEHRLPRTRAQAANLYFFLDGQPGLRSLIQPDRKEALVHLRVKGDARPALEQLEKFLAEERRPLPVWPSRADLNRRLLWLRGSLLKMPVTSTERDALASEVELVELPSSLDPGWAVERKRVVDEFFASEEVPAFRDPAVARAAAEAGLADLRAIFVTQGPSEEEAMLAFRGLSQRLDEARRHLAINRSMKDVLGPLEIGGIYGIDPIVGDRAEQMLDDLFAPEPLEKTTQPLTVTVAGEPLLDRGFSRSVAHNQERSLLWAIAATVALLLLLFRSVRTAVLCMLPALSTLAILFGVLGATGRSIDLGTSLVAGIATGAGSDFAMHYLWYLRRQSVEEVTRQVGPIMLVGVGIVALGFATLSLGRSPVMQLFGVLAGSAMALSAALTCLLLPALAAKLPHLDSQLPRKDL